MADPLGLVYKKQEGSGAAQIFGPSEAVRNLRGFGQQELAANDAARKKALDAAKPKPQSLTEFGQPWRVDQKYISDAIGLFTKGATQKIAAGIDLSTDAEYIKSANLIRTAIEGSTQQQKIYDELTKSVINAPDKFDVAATLAQLKEWEQIPLMQRLSTPMPDPVYKPEKEKEVTFDLFKETSTIEIPYTTTKKYNDDTSGMDITAPNTKSLYEQSKTWIGSRDDVYQWGLKPKSDGKPLWTNKDEAAEYIYQLKKSQAKYTSDEILARESNSNVFGSGKTKDEVILAKEDWKKKFVMGEEEAAAYITGTAKNGVSTNDGYVLEGVRTKTYNLENPSDMERAMDELGLVRPPGVSLQVLKDRSPQEYQKLIDGVKSQYKNDYGGNTLTVYKYKGVGTPIIQEDENGKKFKTPDVKEQTIIANTLTDEELNDFFVSKVRKSGRVFGYDYGITESGKIKVTDKEQPKNVGSTAPKDKTFKRSDLKPYITETNTEEVLINYYKSQGYKLID